MRSLFFALAMTVCALASVQAHAADRLPSMIERLAAASEPVVTRASLSLPRPGAEQPSGGIIHRAQGGECRFCRRRCYLRFRIDCDASEGWCRRQFVLCMRDCWEDYCR